MHLYLKGLWPKLPLCLWGPALRGTAQDVVRKRPVSCGIPAGIPAGSSAQQCEKKCSSLMIFSIHFYKFGSHLGWILRSIWVRYALQAFSGPEG